MAKDSIKYIVDSKDLQDAFQDLPKTVIKRGISGAVRAAMKPELSAVKLSIRKELIRGVSKKGVRDYARGIKIKVKQYRSGTAVGMVGVDRDYTVPNSQQRKKRNYTKWNFIAHLFEFGTRQNIPAYEPIGKVQRSDNKIIQSRYARNIWGSIEKAARRHNKIKSLKK